MSQLNDIDHLIFIKEMCNTHTAPLYTNEEINHQVDLGLLDPLDFEMAIGYCELPN